MRRIIFFCFFIFSLLTQIVAQKTYYINLEDNKSFTTKIELESVSEKTPTIPVTFEFGFDQKTEKLTMTIHYQPVRNSELPYNVIWFPNEELSVKAISKEIKAKYEQKALVGKDLKKDKKGTGIIKKGVTTKQLKHSKTSFDFAAPLISSSEDKMADQLVYLKGRSSYTLEFDIEDVASNPIIYLNNPIPVIYKYVNFSQKKKMLLQYAIKDMEFYFMIKRNACTDQAKVMEVVGKETTKLGVKLQGLKDEISSSVSGSCDKFNILRDDIIEDHRVLSLENKYTFHGCPTLADSVKVYRELFKQVESLSCEVDKPCSHQENMATLREIQKDIAILLSKKAELLDAKGNNNQAVFTAILKTVSNFNEEKYIAVREQSSKGNRCDMIAACEKVYRYLLIEINQLNPKTSSSASSGSNSGSKTNCDVKAEDILEASTQINKLVSRYKNSKSESVKTDFRKITKLMDKKLSSLPASCKTGKVKDAIAMYEGAKKLFQSTVK
ncbi:hypothetical protein LJC68_00170 [Bacteroidales bacterium OttesenSCG-928-B11]|nr:hypothetical protein [Bacteroidales bacterium OttesenSCG-928-E04]MDL2308415.1 hypothetical protein [Bacteroidales bacterium OttesenSCG-928-C03]MDL2311279.1 hypothetical protein [Bacteroidales bacterium OttesenSCG-928-B11]MDL2326853.1 hypothetical protein [Bacteroidales bacterium OttesenSCG-928-A14]